MNRIGQDGAQFLAGALETNRVNDVLNYLSHSYRHYSTQTLTTLNLKLSWIGAYGTLHLALALRTNTVSHTLTSLSHIDCDYSTQTLISLDLSDNGIGNKGTQFLTTVLKSNRVSKFLLYQLRIFSLLSFDIDSHNAKSSKQ